MVVASCGVLSLLNASQTHRPGLDSGRKTRLQPGTGDSTVGEKLGEIS